MSHPIQSRDHMALAIRPSARAQHLGPVAVAVGQVGHDARSGQAGVASDGLALSGKALAGSRMRMARDGAPQTDEKPGFFRRLWEGIKAFFGFKPEPVAPPRPTAPTDPAAEARFRKLVGADEVYARLLVAAGFRTLEQVANTAPETLHAAIRQANEKYGIARRLPSLEHVRAWVADARRLTQPQEPPAPPAEPLIEAWFTDTYQTEEVLNEATAHNNENNPEKAMVRLIDRAQHSIDAALFEIEEPSVVDALIRAKSDPARKVEIRIVTDTDYYYDRTDRTRVHPQIQRLLDAGIPIVQDNRGALMHNKFMVVDRKHVWTGSFNVSENAAFRQNNNAIKLTSPELAENYTVEFDEMFKDRQFGPKSPRNTPHPVVKIGDVEIETLFAAEDEVNARLADLVSRAEKSVKFLAFSFTDDTLGDAMIAKAAEGKIVEGVFEKIGGTTKYSEYGKMKVAGLDVHLDGNPTFMHEKVILIDDSTVVTGSFNFSSGADGDNDENLLIIRNAPELVKKYLADYERVKAAALEAEAEKAAKAAAKASSKRDGAAAILRRAA